MKLSLQLCTLASAVTLTAWAYSARAQSCNATADCPKNFLCSVVGYTGCGTAGAGSTTPGAGAATSTGNVATAGSAFAAAGGAGATMPVSVGGSPVIDCGVQVQLKQCVALSCASDTDCAVGWACKTNLTTTCPTTPVRTTVGGGTSAGVAATAGIGNTFAAAGGSASDVAMPAAGATSIGCTTTSESTCQPKAQDPCAISDDCGPGYDCVDQVSCGCSSSGSAGVASGAAPATTAAGGTPAIPSTASSSGSAPNCTCAPSGVKGCQAQSIACVATSDCPETWTCVGTVDSTGILNGTCEPPYPYFNGGANYGNSGSGGSTSTGAIDVSKGTGSTAPITDTNGVSGPSNGASAPRASSGGCQTGRGHVGSFAALLFGAVATLGVRRRRQRG